MTIFCSGSDTLDIYKNKSGIPYKEYKRVWKGKEFRKVYSISDYEETDVTFETTLNQIYIRVYSKNETLEFEGDFSTENGFNGEKRFYFKNGKIKRIENYAKHKHYTIESDYYHGGTAAIFPSKEVSPSGKWEYYSKNGELKKQVEYKVTKTEKVPIDLFYIKSVSKMKKKHFKVIRNKILESIVHVT